MVNAQLKKVQDKYFLVNNEITPITYVLKRLTGCTSYFAIFSGTLDPATELEVTLAQDGEYQLIVTNAALEEVTLGFKNYICLQHSLIENIYYTLCDCDCECSDCDSDCEYTLMTHAKMQAYKRLINPEGQAFFDAINTTVKCLIEKPIYCSVTEEMIRGSATYNEKLLKQFLALDYLALYFFELSMACLTADKQYITDKFNTEQLFCCINSLGIDIKEIENIIEDMAQMTINSGSYVNQAPSAVGNNTIAVSNRAVTILTLAMFTTLTTPAYADPEGDPVDALRVDTLPVDGVLKLNGVLVLLGDIISAADINLNLFTYESPDQDALDTDDFQFSLRDTGSLIFSS